MKRAIEGGRAIALDPMNGRDRRTIHISVREYDGVATMSIGEGRFRQVVVVPEGAPEYEEARPPEPRLSRVGQPFHVEPFHVELRASPRTRASRSWGTSTDPGQLERWEKLALLLERWSQRINLTGHRGALAIAERLLLEAAALSQVLPAAETIADLGSGAGIPGLPLAICRPRLPGHGSSNRASAATTFSAPRSAIWASTMRSRCSGAPRSSRCSRARA